MSEKKKRMHLYFEYVCGNEEGPLQLSPVQPALTVAGTDRDVQQTPVAPVRPSEVVKESAVTLARPPVRTKVMSAREVKNDVNVRTDNTVVTQGKLRVVVVKKNFLL